MDPDHGVRMTLKRSVVTCCWTYWVRVVRSAVLSSAGWYDYRIAAWHTVRRDVRHLSAVEGGAVSIDHLTFALHR